MTQRKSFYVVSKRKFPRDEWGFVILLVLESMALNEGGWGIAFWAVTTPPGWYPQNLRKVPLTPLTDNSAQRRVSSIALN